MGIGIALSPLFHNRVLDAGLVTSGLVVDLDFGDPASITPTGGSAPISDAERIERIANKGSGPDFIAAVTHDPLWDDDEINGFGAFKDTDSNWLESESAIDLSGGCTMYAVHKATAASRALAEQSSSTSLNDGILLSTIDGTALRLAGATTTVNIGSSPTTDGTTRILFGHSYNGALSRVWENSTSNLLGSSATDHGTLPSDIIYVGARDGGTLDFEGGITRLVIYDRVHSDAEIAQNVSYLDGRYL